MINLKFSGALAVFGFVLSFILGLMGDVAFGNVMLRAVISALVTGCTAAIVSFVFRRYLSEDAAVNVSPKSSAATGSVVDIRIDEEPLPDTDNSPDFYVSQSLSSAASRNPYAGQTVQQPKAVRPEPQVETAPQKSESNVFEKPAAPGPKVETFVPKPLVPQKENATVPDKTAPRNMNVSENKVDDEQLDSLSELPDIEDMISDSVKSESGVIEDSAFAAEGLSSGLTVPDVNPANDTKVIADAIRTLLKREG